MSFISKNDKKTWEEYIINFKQFTLNTGTYDQEKKIKKLKKNLIQNHDSVNSFRSLNQ